MNNFIISQQLAQAIANYLQTRPYSEVAGMIAELAQMKPEPEPKETAKKERQDKEPLAFQEKAA